VKIEADEYVTVRKTTKRFTVDRAIPLSSILEWNAQFIKSEIEGMARELGYFGMHQHADSYDAPQITVHFRVDWHGRVTEGGTA